MASRCVDLDGVSCLKIYDPYRDGFCAPEQLVARLRGTIDGKVGVWHGDTTADGARTGWGNVELCEGKEVWVNYDEAEKATVSTSIIVAYDEAEDEFRTQTGGRYRARSLRSAKDGPVPTEPGWRGECMVPEEGGGYQTVSDDGELQVPWWTVVTSDKRKLAADDEGERQGGKGAKRTREEEGGEERDEERGEKRKRGRD